MAEHGLLYAQVLQTFLCRFGHTYFYWMGALNCSKFRHDTPVMNHQPQASQKANRNRSFASNFSVLQNNQKSVMKHCPGIWLCGVVKHTSYTTTSWQPAYRQLFSRKNAFWWYIGAKSEGYTESKLEACRNRTRGGMDVTWRENDYFPEIAPNRAMLDGTVPEGSGAGYVFCGILV